MISTKYIIIGAGLSGLTTAYMLHKMGETNFLVLESRERIGGRILTENGIDLGATWFQNHHENVIDLLDELKVKKFHQYNKGKSVLVYNSMAPEHYFENDPNHPSAYRIGGGSLAIINALAKAINNTIKTEQTVTAIEDKGNTVIVTTDKKTYSTEKVIITIPPRITERISFSPELPKELTTVMKTTHTWMSNAIKMGLTFKTPFWRNKNFSGMLIGQVGAVVELYDHNDVENNTYALMGFVNEALRDLTPEARKTKILDYLKKYLGDEILSHIHYKEKDWSKDKDTSCKTIKSIYMSPSYGNPVFAQEYFGEKLLFSGTETSPIYGGYMDGAIYSGIIAANKLTIK